IPARHVETAAALVRLAAAGGVERLLDAFEQRLTRGGDEIGVVEEELIVAGVALGPDKHGFRRDCEAIAGEEPGPGGVVCHLRERRGIWAAAAAATGAAVMRRFMGIIQA